GGRADGPLGDDLADRAEDGLPSLEGDRAEHPHTGAREEVVRVRDVERADGAGCVAEVDAAVGEGDARVEGGRLDVDGLAGLELARLGDRDGRERELDVPIEPWLELPPAGRDGHEDARRLDEDRAGDEL